MQYTLDHFMPPAVRNRILYLMNKHETSDDEKREHKKIMEDLRNTAWEHRDDIMKVSPNHWFGDMEPEGWRAQWFKDHIGCRITKYHWEQ